MKNIINKTSAKSKNNFYPLAEKAYMIKLSKIHEGYMYDNVICYAESLNKAKSKLIKEVEYNDFKLIHSDDEITYLNIPVIRAKEYDKYYFEDKSITLTEIKTIISDKKRIENLGYILRNNNISYCYIKKGSYYRPNSCGYTDMRHRAGVYTKSEAVSHAMSCRDIDVIPIDVSEHNKIINKEIDELKTRLII